MKGWFLFTSEGPFTNKWKKAEEAKPHKGEFLKYLVYVEAPPDAGPEHPFYRGPDE